MDPLKTGMMICEARKKLKMTQKDLASKLYVSDKAVSKWERGLCFPDISVLIPLTEILNISLYDLLRGEKMDKKDIEETLKKTIDYSNREVKKKKKKYIIISIIIILIIILISTIIIVNNNSLLSKIVKKDKIYGIDYYQDYKATLNEKDDSEKIENLIGRLSLSWTEYQADIKNDEIDIIYNEKYKTVVKIYKDELYVKKSIINNATILFTTISNLETFSVSFSDYKYSIKRNDLLSAYGISSFDELNQDNWEQFVSKKINNSNFIDNTFNNAFKKDRVLKEELNLDLTPDR